VPWERVWCGWQGGEAAGEGCVECLTRVQHAAAQQSECLCVKPPLVTMGGKQGSFPNTSRAELGLWCAL
jgi:hypothetical protein